MQLNRTSKLKDKFLRQFIIPILFGILGSICFSIFFLTYFSNYYFKRKMVREELQKLISYDRLAKMKSFTQLVYSTVQGDISKLEKIRDSYQFLIEQNLLPSSIQNDEIAQINDNIINVLNLPSIDIDDPLDYGRWFINTTSNLVDFDNPVQIQKQLYTLTHLLILFRSIAESDNDPDISKLNFTLFFDSTELYFDYPYKTDDVDKFKLAMPQWCLKDDIIKTPNYYYFKCSDLYYKIKEFETQNLEVSINDVHSNGSDFIYSICLKALEPGYTPISFFYICLTKSITQLWDQLDEFNSMLQGYFFIYTINSIVPFYYPKSIRKKVIDDIKKEEFFLNSSYYIDELIDFSQLQKKFSQRYNDTTSIPSITFMKNNIMWNCTIEPIKYHLQTKSGEIQEHFQSIILVTSYDLINQYKYITNSWITKNVAQGIIFFLVGIVMTKLIIFMIIALAEIIVRPIRNIKRILKRLNTNKKRESSAPNTFKLKNSVINDNDNSNNNHHHQNTNEENPLLISESNQQDSELQHEDNEEDEYISTRSKDVNTVFYKLVDLKNSLEALSNESLTFIDNNLLNYIFAQHNFHVINNSQASHLCNSNIGNLLLKTKQYDKAIYHFQDSIKEITEEEVIKINLSNITSIDEHLEIIKKKKGDSMKKADLKKKKIIESRYPKLLYAYKKYFKSFKKLKNNSTKNNYTLDQHNEFSSVHLLSAYKQALIHYIEITFDYGDKYNIKIAMIEYFNFLLDYELADNDQIITSDKKNIISEIFHLCNLLQVKENQKTKDQMQLEVNQLMLLIQNLKLESDVVDQIKIPSTVLNQKVVYLKGKLFFICGHYKSALNFFMETLQIDLVSDAKIVLLSLQKILQIAEKYYKAIDDACNHMQSNRRDGLIKILEDIHGFIQKKQEQISLFNLIPKDICIILMNKSQLSKALDIYENMISEYDRITFIYYDEKTKDIQLICRLSYKNNSDIEDIRNYFKRIVDNKIYTDDILQTDKETMSKGDICEVGNEIESILIWARNYLIKKTTSNKITEKWFIYLKNSLNYQETQYLMKKNIKKDLFWDSPWYNLVIVLLERSNINKECSIKYNHSNNSKNKDNCSLIGNNKEEEELLIKKLSFNKSGIIYNDIMEVLKEKMSIRGIINKRNEFPQEKYEDIK